MHLSHIPSSYMQVYFVCIVTSFPHVLTRHWQATTRKRRSKNCNPQNSPQLTAPLRVHPQRPKFTSTKTACSKLFTSNDAHSKFFLYSLPSLAAHSCPSYTSPYLIATTPFRYGPELLTDMATSPSSASSPKSNSDRWGGEDSVAPGASKSPLPSPTREDTKPPTPPQPVKVRDDAEKQPHAHTYMHATDTHAYMYTMQT